jgi:DNA-binding LacI/PurR family transcriptional regulator
LKKQGYKVPEDVSVVGFGDGLLAANYSVPLTTVRHPQVDLGKAAFNLWYQWMHNGNSLGGRVLPVELIERSSTRNLRG